MICHSRTRSILKSREFWSYQAYYLTPWSLSHFMKFLKLIGNVYDYLYVDITTYIMDPVPIPYFKKYLVDVVSDQHGLHYFWYKI